jgi:hypothetical protein
LALRGCSGQRITKKFIHEQLTPSRYAPQIHDNRLHQLLSRLSKFLSSHDIEVPWLLTGDNHITLNCAILDMESAQREMGPLQ